MSRYQPYQPMGPPRKEVSQERMLEILAKHGAQRTAVEVRTTPAPPDNRATQILVWSEPRKDTQNLWIILSKCERYSIHAIRGGVGLPWRYEALRRTPNWNNVLAPGRLLTSKEEAVKLCEEHARAQP